MRIQIKPIVWEPDDFGIRSSAESCIQYSICHENECAWDDTDCTWEVKSHPYQLVRYAEDDEIMGDYSTLAEAKSAAENDYQKRVRAVIFLSP